MIKYVAFLRAINLGGRNTIKMADLRKLFEGSGFKKVRTYIQSGNVIFDAKETSVAALAASLESQIREAFGHDVKVLLQTLAELAETVRGNPFTNIQPGDDIRMFVTFIAAAPRGRLKLPLMFPKENVEVLGLGKRALLVVCRRKANGQLEFPNALFEKELRMSATTRNWTTVNKVLEMAQKS